MITIDTKFLLTWTLYNLSIYLNNSVSGIPRPTFCLIVERRRLMGVQMEYVNVCLNGIFRSHTEQKR